MVTSIRHMTHRIFLSLLESRDTCLNSMRKNIAQVSVTPPRLNIFNWETTLTLSHMQTGIKRITHTIITLYHSRVTGKTPS